MSRAKDNSGPAFPQVTTDSAFEDGKVYSNTYSYGGMTIREHFAVQAIASMTIAPDYSKGPCNSAMVERAVLIADLLIAELAKPQ